MHKTPPQQNLIYLWNKTVGCMDAKELKSVTWVTACGSPDDTQCPLSRKKHLVKSFPKYHNQISPFCCLYFTHQNLRGNENSWID